MPSLVADSFQGAIGWSLANLKNWGQPVEVEKWHGLDVRDQPHLVSIEVLDLSFSCPMPASISQLSQQIRPNLPWADDHFVERVGGKPLNPGEEYRRWPYYYEGSQQDAEFRRQGGKFTHTYMERFWPKGANSWPPDDHWGIRYLLGDLSDLVSLLHREPHTRQAFLPVWFPEDTGAVHRGRVPCTIGYHFMLRDYKLHLWYTIRSCDAIRYFRDDVYMAARLALWVLAVLRARGTAPPGDEPSFNWFEIIPGNFHFHAFSFHCFQGDIDRGNL